MNLNMNQDEKYEGLEGLGSSGGLEGRQDEGWETKATENMAGWKRALADYDNLKKDLSRERSDIRRMAVESAVEGFMPVLEHFDAAVQFVPEFQGKEKNWAQGVLHIRRELEDALKSLGVESFGEVGESFDPLKHEAVGDRAEEGKETGSIVEVASRGWKITDRILRPARVIVSK